MHTIMIIVLGIFCCIDQEGVSPSGSFITKVISDCMGTAAYFGTCDGKLRWKRIIQRETRVTVIVLNLYRQK